MNTYGPLSDHVIVRLADEGVPVAALVRAFKRPFGDIHQLLAKAKHLGQLLELPQSDWPPGSRRDTRASAIAPIRAADINDMLLALMRQYRLTRQEARMLATLVRRPHATKATLHAAIKDDPDGVGSPKIVDVVACKLRRKLTPHGIEIVTVWGRGYYLAPASTEIVAAAVGEFNHGLAEIGLRGG